MGYNYIKPKFCNRLAEFARSAAGGGLKKSMEEAYD